MNWIQDMNKCTGPAAQMVGPVVEVRGMLANGVQIPLPVRGVYDLRDGKTGVYVTMPDNDEVCQPDGLRFDAFGELRKRYVRVSLGGNHCVMRPQEGDTYAADAHAAGDDSPYVVRAVYLSEREFEDLPEHDGF